MNHSTDKRKRRNPQHTIPRCLLKHPEDDTSPEFDPFLYIVTYVVDIVGGPRPVSTALALECPEALSDSVDKSKTAFVRKFEPQNTVVGDVDVVDRYVRFVLYCSVQCACLVSVGATHDQIKLWPGAQKCIELRFMPVINAYNRV